MKMPENSMIVARAVMTIACFGVVAFSVGIIEGALVTSALMIMFVGLLQRDSSFNIVDE